VITCVGNSHIAVFPPSGRASAQALCSGRMWQLTAGDFHSQGNPAEVRPVSQQQPHRVQCGLHCVQSVSDSRTCSVSKSTNELLMVGEVFAHCYLPPHLSSKLFSWNIRMHFSFLPFLLQVLIAQLNSQLPYACFDVLITSRLSVVHPGTVSLKFSYTLNPEERHLVWWWWRSSVWFHRRSSECATCHEL
jgi:hypothetical protein